jgi:hypothetical protein
VRAQAVPDEDDPLTSEVPFEIVQERDEPDVGIGVRLALEKKRVRRPSQRKAKAPATESRFQFAPV